jgi:hypothetical protein
MVLSNELWQKPPSGPTGLLNAGVYADGSDGYSHSPNGDTYYTRFAVSFWYRNDYATSIGTYMMGGNHGNGADHGMTCVGGDGYVYVNARYNGSNYHQLKSSSALSSAQRATNTWHHYHFRAGSSGNLTVHIDGTEMISATVTDYVDAFTRYQGYDANPLGVGNLSGGPSFSLKGVTYMAQLIYTSGNSPHVVGDILNDDGEPIDALDLDGSGTELVTDRTGRTSGTGIWLFGANGTTSSLTHNSAADGQGTNITMPSSLWALSTDSNIFPITGITA